jgi:hypothetical protein
MDERLRICLWIVGGGGFCGVLGGIFGSLAAALYARNGGAAGTRLARNVVENLLQSGDRPPSPTLHAAIVGAVDGFFFLGIFGLIGGVFLGKSGRTGNELLVPMMVGSVSLIVGAIIFGIMAYALTYRVMEVLYGLAGTFLGGLLSPILSDSNPFALAFCYAAGGIIGVSLCRAVRAYSPKFKPLRVAKAMSQPRSDAGTDITNSPPSSSNDDFFHKPDSFKKY